MNTENQDQLSSIVLNSLPIRLVLQFKALQTVTIDESGNRFGIRSQGQGVCGKIFQAVWVTIHPRITEHSQRHRE